MIALASDHAGLQLKKTIIDHLQSRGLEYKDFGTYNEDSCDYPIYAKLAANAVSAGEAERAIVVCGTGIGVSIAANKVKGIRCALCDTEFLATRCRNHNDANVLALGQQVVDSELALKIVDVFLDTAFEGGRHSRRVQQIEG